MSVNVLTIENLHATVADKPIIRGLDLVVPAGEVHAIMGPNGAGKSTLAYVLGGRPGYEVTEGRATFDAADLLAMEPHERAAAGLFLGFQYPVEIPGVSYLQFLREKFGNLGLAAAAYNGGENGVARFIAGTGYLAAETLDYVQIITGIPVTQWLVADVPTADYTLADDKPFHDACVALAETRTLKAFTPPTAIIQPWGIQMQQFFSEATARRFFSRIQADYPSVLGSEELMLVARRNPNFGRALRYRVEVGRQSRKAATELCAELRKSGGVCVVVSN